jgi:hypothetical protein
MANESAKPTDEAMVAAYSATAALHANEGQLIWQRVSNFLLMNGVLAGVLAALMEFGNKSHEALWVISLVAAAGVYFCIFHMVSIGRAWRYHDGFLALMKRQELALNLGALGPASALPEILAIKPTGRLERAILLLIRPFNARTTEAFTTFMAVVAYVGVVVWVNYHWT